jgi:hypothetical protein
MRHKPKKLFVPAARKQQAHTGMLVPKNTLEFSEGFKIFWWAVLSILWQGAVSKRYRHI